jgi:DNA repair protein RadC
MRITTYKTKLNEDKLNILVKEKSTNYEISGLTSPESIFNMMNNVFDMQNLAEEYLYMIACDSKQKVLGVFEISHGTVNASLINPREIFIRALLCGAVNIILTHNHPSGNSYPSAEDNRVTRRIKECGELMGINLLDHIIIGDNFYSFKQEGMM